MWPSFAAGQGLTSMDKLFREFCAFGRCRVHPLHYLPFKTRAGNPTRIGAVEPLLLAHPGAACYSAASSAAMTSLPAICAAILSAGLFPAIFLAAPLARAQPDYRRILTESNFCLMFLPVFMHLFVYTGHSAQSPAGTTGSGDTVIVGSGFGDFSMQADSDGWS